MALFSFQWSPNLANTPQARKRARQSETRRKHNQTLRSRMRTAIKKASQAAGTGNAETAQAAFSAAVPEIDSMVNKGILHRNTAARYKSQLNKKLKASSTHS